LHSLLNRQFEKTIGDFEDIPKKIHSFVEMVNQAYYDFDEDRVLSERSLEITSTELVDRYDKLKEDKQKLVETQKELEKKEKLQAASLLEKEALLAEIHHRVKNNLATIAGLLFFQMDMETDGQVRIKLREAQHRIQTMAMIHEMLYKSDSFSSIRIDKYLNQLVQSIIDNFKNEGQNIEMEIRAKNLLLDIETAIPIALMVNEIVTNSLKYAFPNDGEGLISIKLADGSDHNVQLAIGDNGVGMSENIDLDNPNSMGVLLIRTFIQQLKGTMEVDTADGTTFNFTIPFSTLLKKRNNSVGFSR